MKRYFALIYFLLPLLLLTGCFTGVESTPRITSDDVRKENIKETPELKFLSDIYTPNPRLWQNGRLFYISDDRINRVMSPVDKSDASLYKGQYVVFENLSPVLSVTGDNVARLLFTSEGGKSYEYRSEVPYHDFVNKADFELPFAVDMVMVDTVRSRMKGNTYFITSPLWYDETGTLQRRGLRHVDVEVVDVKPGNENYPALVIFRPNGSNDKYSVYMTVGNRRTATRNFETLFDFENPRLKHKSITDENWNYIVHSRVRPGMTKDECRLALGSPNVHGQRPTTAGMVEYWQYSDGRYLLFEEGLLTIIR